MTLPADARTVLDLFDRACASGPDACAIEVPGRSRTTYAELDRLARLAAARMARAAGGAHEPIVAIALPRTDVALHAAILGAMRAGAAYVAIDPSFPPRQAAEIVADACAAILVASPERAAEIGSAMRPDGARPVVIAPDELVGNARHGDVEGVTPSGAPSELAYLVYTSGTTGRPKGVEIGHASLLNLVAGDLVEFGLRPGDRVAQGSSASYDSSVEELWLAWAAGATAVVMDDETSRLGPDLVPWLVRERITVLCPPPTLLRTLDCDDPVTALPAVRLLYVGGEALPPDLAERWSRGRRLENGYGPTECTVTCLRGTVRPGEAVTIGRAIPGVVAHVIDPDAPDLAPIEDGREGELVVGGAALARGYRNQPETTGMRFIEHPTLGRIYRTGDLVHRDSRGEFHYHGRIDAQVKLRGYRIELGAVEARLAAHPAVLEAACTVEDEGPGRRLVAHVVPRLQAGAPTKLEAAEIRRFVAETLPPYMVPATVVGIGSIPRTVGGKIDRRRLPQAPAADAARTGLVAPPETATELALAEAIASSLGMTTSGREIDVDADFFDDLGLDSLTIAMAVSKLRRNEKTRAATVRLAYRHRTVRSAAAALEAVAGAGADGPDRVERPHRGAHPSIDRGRSRPKAATTLQSAFLLVLLLAGSQLLWIPDAGAFVADRLAGGVGSVLAMVGVAAAAVIAYAALSIAVGVAAKWLLIGRYRPMRARGFSLWHVRHWMVVRCVSLAPWDVLEALGLAPTALRLLGARVGRGVHVHRGVRLTDGGWDLIRLDDGATIGRDACLRAVELEAGHLVVGPIRVGRGATLETRAGMGPGAELGAGSILRALSNLTPPPDGGDAPEHVILDGVPARVVGRAPQPPDVASPPAAILRALGGLAIFGSIAVAAMIPWIAALRWTGLVPDATLETRVFGSADAILPTFEGLLRLALATVAASVATVLVLAALVRLLGAPPGGAFPLAGFAALRMSLQSMLVEAAGKWLSGTLLWPTWLRLAGARIGRDCEISTVTDVVPSTVAIGSETFFADGIYLGGPMPHAGTATLAPVSLGESCFVGNHAVLPSGTRLAPATLVGISTRGDGLPEEPGRSWFGHPAFELPRREVVSAPRALTHDPPLVRRINRWCWELARFALPMGPVFVALVWFRLMERAEATLPAALFRLAALPLGTLAALVSLALATLVLKWILVGRVRPGTHPLWSCWCSRWDFLYVAWGMWAAGALAFLEGTLLLVGYLRLMGCRIGRRALLGSGFAHVVDPDMLRFGDDVTVQALFQAHTFEDRVLKIDHVHVGDGATVGANAVMLYGADVGARSVVRAHSVVMKREILAPDSIYEGVPTELAGACRDRP